jgi:hypothetical protein
MISKVAATVIPLAIVLMFVAANEQPQPRPPYIMSEYEGDLLKLEREAIDAAFSAQITKLWQVWMSDDKGQPDRAVNGASQARKAYVASRHAIDKREAELRSK